MTCDSINITGERREIRAAETDQVWWKWRGTREEERGWVGLAKLRGWGTVGMGISMRKSTELGEKVVRGDRD